MFIKLYMVTILHVREGFANTQKEGYVKVLYSIKNYIGTVAIHTYYVPK
jgi:hypothetical protein